MTNLIRSLYARLRAAWPVNRVVALLTPAFAAIAGYVSTWVAQHFPGVPPIDESWLAGVFIVGAASAIAAAYRWLDGWQKYEDRTAVQPPAQRSE